MAAALPYFRAVAKKGVLRVDRRMDRYFEAHLLLRLVSILTGSIKTALRRGGKKELFPLRAEGSVDHAAAVSGSGEKWRYQRRRIVHHYLAPFLPPSLPPLLLCFD